MAIHLPSVPPISSCLSSFLSPSLLSFLSFPLLPFLVFSPLFPFLFSFFLCLLFPFLSSCTSLSYFSCSVPFVHFIFLLPPLRFFLLPYLSFTPCPSFLPVSLSFLLCSEKERNPDEKGSLVLPSRHGTFSLFPFVILFIALCLPFSSSFIVFTSLSSRLFSLVCFVHFIRFGYGFLIIYLLYYSLTSFLYNYSKVTSLRFLPFSFCFS